MKVWISKYALSEGVTEHEARHVVGPNGREYVEVNGLGWFRLGRSAFDNRDGAIAQAEDMRTKKIVSLKRQLAKLEALRFE
jgi:hypothetical protein